MIEAVTSMLLEKVYIRYIEAVLNLFCIASEEVLSHMIRAWSTLKLSSFEVMLKLSLLYVYLDKIE